MEQKVTKVACEILIKNGDDILLGKRRNSFGAGTWALPGGHLEYGETLSDCAIRELQEELGIKPVDIKLIAVTDTFIEQQHYIHATFLVQQYVGNIRCMEPKLCYEWRFFNTNQLPDELFEPHKKILKTYLYKTNYLIV